MNVLDFSGGFHANFHKFSGIFEDKSLSCIDQHIFGVWAAGPIFKLLPPQLVNLYNLDPYHRF